MGREKMGNGYSAIKPLESQGSTYIIYIFIL